MFQSITTGVGRYIELSVAKSRIPPLSCSGDNCEHTDHRGYHKSHPCGKVRFAADSALEEDGFEPSVPPVKETAVERGIRSQPSSSGETRA
jgi:hypothetical protein